ncbi:MAG TPA: dephospho-CoA kinase [Chthoniobacterales bacterium]
MPAIGITGGIATGKTTVSRALHSRLEPVLPVDFFSADIEARRLTDADFGVQEEVRSAFGGAVFDSSGTLARDRLRVLVFGNAGARKILEGILHPRIREAWQNRLRKETLLLAEIPLLYETGAAESFDKVIVTACSRESQIERLTTGRNLPRELATQMILAQMPLEEKVRRANHVIWTDCPPDITISQGDLLISELIKRYGGTSAA